MDITDSLTTRVIAAALDGHSQRHNALIGNIANADTPGYRGLRVSFESQLKEAYRGPSTGGGLKMTPSAYQSGEFLPIPQAGVKPSAEGIGIERDRFFYTLDNNSVDIDSEMAQLARNSERYTALSRLEAKAFTSLRETIKG